MVQKTEREKNKGGGIGALRLLLSKLVYHVSCACCGESTLFWVEKWRVSMFLAGDLSQTLNLAWRPCTF